MIIIIFSRGCEVQPTHHPIHKKGDLHQKLASVLQ